MLNWLLTCEFSDIPLFTCRALIHLVFYLSLILSASKIFIQLTIYFLRSRILPRVSIVATTFLTIFICDLYCKDGENLLPEERHKIRNPLIPCNEHLQLYHSFLRRTKWKLVANEQLQFVESFLLKSFSQLLSVSAISFQRLILIIY